MMKIILFIAISFVFSIEYGQSFKTLNLSYVHVLYFSVKAKAEWAHRDTLLNSPINLTLSETFFSLHRAINFF